MVVVLLFLFVVILWFLVYVLIIRGKKLEWLLEFFMMYCGSDEIKRRMKCFKLWKWSIFVRDNGVMSLI